MDLEQKTSIAYLGMGIMGSSMALNLVNAGFDLTVWNRTSGKDSTQKVVKAGAKEAGSIKEAVSAASIIILCLSDVSDLEDVLFRADGVLANATAGSIIVDMSTTGPQCAQSVYAKLKDKGLHFIDAPVSGGDVGARNATLTIMAGGDREAFENCLSVFEKIGKNIHYCGPSGSGQAIKLCNQILCAVNMIGVCEALTLAKSLGVEESLMVEVCGSGAAGSWSLSNLGPRIIAGNLEPGFMIKDMQKDLRLVSEAIPELSSAFAGTELARSKFKQASSRFSDSGEFKGTQAMIAAYQTEK